MTGTAHRLSTARILLLVAALVAGLAVAGGGARAQGDDLAKPVPFKQEATAGPWRLTVEQVVTGDDANAQVAAASQFNEPVADGLAYVAVQIKAQNAGSTPLRIDNDDFGVAGKDGIVRRFVGAAPPAPALDAVVKPGEAADGWVVGAAAANETDLVLVYDSATLTGNWADATLALADGAALADEASRAVKANKTGRDPGNPAGIGEQVATRTWAVTLDQVVTGQDVIGIFPASDYRTTALLGAGPETADTWLAFQFTITNNATGDQPGALPVSAFNLADADGNPVPDLTTLTPPSPDAAGTYAPGATRQGWVVFDAKGYDGPSLLRFQPFRTDGDPRFIAFDGSGGSAPAPTPAFTGTLAVGATVTTTDDGVRMRKTASADGKIVAELDAGTVLTITGAPEDAGGITWYPVKNAKTGDAGYVASQFLKPAT